MNGKEYGRKQWYNLMYCPNIFLGAMNKIMKPLSGSFMFSCPYILV